jgi:NAD-dependent deacetylase
VAEPRDCANSSHEHLASLATELREDPSGYLLVVTGAGVSLASGIPTFRGTDPGAVWKKDVTELGTCAYFDADPVGSWQWYLSRFDGIADKAPNAGHHALVSLERWVASQGGRFTLVTQNIDTLHRRAGSKSLIEVHGRADRVRCSSDGCARGAPDGSIARDEVDFGPFRAAPRKDNIPRCPACGSLVRAHVLWFDEFYQSHSEYRWRSVLDAAQECSALLFVGTSFAVGVTEALLRDAYYRGVPIYSIDPVASPPEGRNVRWIAMPSEEALVSLLERTRSGEAP